MFSENESDRDCSTTAWMQFDKWTSWNLVIHLFDEVLVSNYMLKTTRANLIEVQVNPLGSMGNQMNKLADLKSISHEIIHLVLVSELSCHYLL